MGRMQRIMAPEFMYHITSRTNGKSLFMRKKRDQKMLCRILKQALLKHGIVLYAFTPMMNHFHMLIYLNRDANLAQFMCEFKAAYARYFNRRYGMSNHFWGDRYRSTLVQDDRHALACLRYLDRNPVKAGLVTHPEQWQFNSFRTYAYGEDHPLLPIELHPTYLGLAKNQAKRRNLYLAFVLDQDEFSDELHGRLERLQFFGSEDFIAAVKRSL